MSIRYDGMDLNYFHIVVTTDDKRGFSQTAAAGAAKGRAEDGAIQREYFRLAILVDEELPGIFKGSIFAPVGNHYHSLHA